MISRKRILKRFHSVLLFLSFSLVILLSIVFCLYIILRWISMSKVEETNNPNRGLNEYQSLWLNSSNQEFTFGSSTITKILSEGEYEFSSYYTMNEKDYPMYSLISRFGEEEYICTGNCYCESITRRTGTTLLSRGLTYLLVSVSLSGAYSLSKKYFEETCVNELKNTCSDLSSIKSEVSDCEDVASSSQTVVDDSHSIEEGGIEEEKKVFKYQCEGNCDQFDYVKGKGDFLDFYSAIEDHKEEETFQDPRIWTPNIHKLADEMLDGSLGFKECHVLKLKGVNVYIDDDDFVKYSEHNPLTKKEQNTILRMKATNEFYPILNDFCRSNSAIKPRKKKILRELLDFFNDNLSLGFNELVTMPTSWCIAAPGRIDDEDEELDYLDFGDYIKCRKMSKVLKKNVKKN